MKELILGAYYRDGNEELIGPMEAYNDTVYCFVANGRHYTRYGQYTIELPCDKDLDSDHPLNADGTPWNEAKEPEKITITLKEYEDLMSIAGKFRSTKNKALITQVGGNHYKYNFDIQPIEFFIANKIPFVEASICKYVLRYKYKNGKQDLEKARHMIDVLIGEYDRKEVNNEQ